MVGLSDIPCVGKIVDRISDAAVDALFRGFLYMFSYKYYVDDLDTKIQKLNTEMEQMSRKVREEEDNGNIIIEGVKKWQREVEEIKKSAEEILEKYKNRSYWRCIQCMPIPKPVSRFRLGREAAWKAEKVTELYDSGKDLLDNEIADPPPVDNAPISDTVYQTFESRSDAYDELWKELESEGGSTVLGIYGMPGVGKTTMMERIWKEAVEKKIFDKVTRADVGSEDLDVLKLQNQIAANLDCHFKPEDDEKHRASKLKNRLVNGKKILIILDDLWGKIPLHRIGIPLGERDSSCHFKILLTSRKEKVCKDNNCPHPVNIAPLGPDEAWQMFRNTVVADNIPDESLAQEVCKKCGGLPLLIHAVGKALQFTSHDVWKDALNQLEMGNVENIPDIDQNVYSCVKLSFEKLPDDAKSCLVLCSLYPEDASIYISKLIPLATGSGLVRDGEDRVRSMIETLRSSSLLLDSEDHIIKVHDLIRDVARSIAVQDYSFSLVRCGSLLPDDVDYQSRKFLRLHLEENDIFFPHGLVCPDLQNLWLQCNNHVQQLGDFFGMFGNLKVLLIEKMLFSKEPQFSLRPLVKLRTLILDGCNISKTNASFFPEILETLCIWHCHLPHPLNLPILKHLRKLEIQGFSGVWCEEVEVQMVPNTISSMTSLQKLHIPGGYNIHDDVSAPILGEISKLTGLKSLQMYFSSESENFEDTDIFGNLLQYNIIIGAGWYQCSLIESSVYFKRVIELRGSGLKSFKGLIERAEKVTLNCTDIDVSSVYNSNREAFTDLKELGIQNCNTIEYLARISRGEIRHSKSFSNLGVLNIENCSAMKYLFSSSVAKCLVQLQKLDIQKCPVMEAIVMNEGTSDIQNCNTIEYLARISRGEIQHLKSFPNLSVLEIRDCSAMKYLLSSSFAKCLGRLQKLVIYDCPLMEAIVMNEGTSNRDADIINFRELKSLTIVNIPRLRSFCMQNNDMHSESTTPDSAISSIQAQPLFDKMAAFPSLEVLILENSGSTIYDIWGNSGYNNIASSFCKLKRICIRKFEKPERVFPLAMSNNLRNLEDLEVSNCPSLKNVFQHFSVVRDLINLQALDISGCEMMRVIIDGKEEEEEAGEEEEEEKEEEEEEEITDDKDAAVVFPKLTSLRLTDLQSLTSFHRSGEDNPLKIQFPNLEVFKLKDCGRMKYDAMELGGDDFNCKLWMIEMTYHRKIQLPSKWYSRLYNLEWLTLVHYHWWPQLKFQCFRSLKELRVGESGCSNLFSFSAFESLRQLQSLEIYNCASLEEIVKDVRSGEHCGTDKRTITLSQLKSVWLTNLPNLKSCFHGANYECHMPALEVVIVDNCGISTIFTCSVFRTVQRLNIKHCALLKDIVEDARTGEHCGTDKRTVTLSQLKSVTLANLPNLKSCFHGANYECHMPALEWVQVRNCGISTIFTCSVFRTVQQLKDLRVYKCELLEDIVEATRGAEPFDTDDKLITTLQLSNIELKDLPNLKSFSSNSNYAFNMPKLDQFFVYGCPQIEYFTSLKTTTPMVTVYSDWHSDERFPDLNDYIRENCKRKDVSSNSAGEVSNSNQEPETDPERVGEQQLQETEENAQR